MAMQARALRAESNRRDVIADRLLPPGLLHFDVSVGEGVAVIEVGRVLALDLLE
jgi:hypothetical protein